MKFQEIVSPSLKDLFVKQIEEMILGGQLAIGSKLPNERELAKQMKVSRSIINNGMQELADKAFITVIPRQGAYVEDYIHNGNINTLVTILRRKGLQLDLPMLRSFIDFRRDLETICAKEAAKSRSETQLLHLEQQLMHLMKTKNTDDFVDASIEFHKLIFIATGNLVYPLIYNAFYEVLYAVTETLLTIISHDKVIEHLNTVLRKIREKEEEQAGESMKIHVELCAQLLKDHYEKLRSKGAYSSQV